MLTLSSLDLPPPRNWQDFEDLCCDLWRLIWNDPDTQKNGRSGQSQAGVDVFGRPERGGEWAGVQCKLRAGPEGLSRKDLEHEIEQARTFKPQLSRFLIATTASRDAAVQEAAREMTTAQTERGAFSVNVAAWDDILLHLTSYPDLLAKYYPGVVSHPDPDLRHQQHADVTGHGNQVIQILGDSNTLVLSQPAITPTGYRCLAPRTHAFISRREYQPILRHLLEAATHGRTVAITTALDGAGGFGKTTLAQALCLDAQLRAAFPEGILWVAFGDQLTDGDRLARLRDLLRRWSGREPPAFETIVTAGGYLCDLLVGRRTLVVVDDVWSPVDLLAFRDLGPTSVLLLTTRDRRHLPVGCLTVNVDAMESEEAVQVLGGDLPGLAPHRLRLLAKRLGEWPLLLDLVRQQIAELIDQDRLPPEQALAEVEAALAEEGLEAFDRHDVEARELAVGRTLSASLRRLSDDERQRYEWLAIFPEDADIPFATLERLWCLPPRRVEAFCRYLHQVCLIVRFEAGPRTIRLHDVLRQYLRSRRRNDLSTIHRHFLSACQPAGGWAELPAQEPYLWRGLAYHLADSGACEELRALLLDYTWLEAKLASTDINALVADYDILAGDPEIRLVQGALRLSAHVLMEHPEELSGQLLGRLLDRAEPAIATLLAGAWPRKRQSWLRPLAASLPSGDGALVRTIEGHAGWFQGVAALSDGRVVSVATDGTLRVWDLAVGKTVRTFEGHSARVLANSSLKLAWASVAELPDGRAVSGCADGTLRVWDLSSGLTVMAFKAHGYAVHTVAALPNGRIGSVAELGRSVRVHDLASGQVVWNLTGHSDAVLAVAVLADGGIVSASADHTLRVWDLTSGQTVKTLEGHSGAVLAVAALPDGRIVSASGDCTLRVWDLALGQTVATLEGHSSSVQAVAVLPDGRIISASQDHTIRVWCLASGQTIRTLAGHTSSVHAVVVLPRGDIVSSDDHTLLVWNLASDQAVRTLERHSGWIYALAALPDGRAVFASDDYNLRVWDLASGRTVRILEGHSRRVKAVAVLPDGRAVSASDDHTLRLWDFASGQTVRTLEGHSRGVSAVAALSDDRVVSGSGDGTLRVWDLASGQPLRILKGRFTDVQALAALPDGRVVVASDYDLYVCDLASGQTVRVYQGRQIVSVAVMLNGHVVGASDDGTLRIWDLTSGRAVMVLERHFTNTVGVLPDGRIVSASDDGTVLIWDLPSGKPLARFTLDVSPIAIAVLSDRCELIVGDYLGQLHYLRWEEGDS